VTAAQQLVRKLGAGVGFSPTSFAMKRIIQYGAGNPVAIRILCSQMLRDARRSPSFNPLANVRPGLLAVRRAARRVASTDKTFRHLFLSWLDPDEEIVLAYVSHKKPRAHEVVSMTDLRRPGPALQKLEAMGVVVRSLGQARIAIPLFEHWAREQLPSPRPVERQRSDRRWRYAIGGVSATAMLFALYVAKIRSERTLREARSDQGSLAVDFPERGYEHQDISIFVFETRHAATGDVPRAELTTAAQHASAIVLDEAVSGCRGSPVEECTFVYRVNLSTTARDAYAFEATGGGKTLRFSVARDWLAGLRGPVEDGFRIVSGLPALLGLFLAFRQDMGRMLRGVFGRGEQPPSA
jgi:hypothetical protein